MKTIIDKARKAADSFLKGSSSGVNRDWPNYKPFVPRIRTHDKYGNSFSGEGSPYGMCRSERRKREASQRKSMREKQRKAETTQAWYDLKRFCQKNGLAFPY